MPVWALPGSMDEAAQGKRKPEIPGVTCCKRVRKGPVTLSTMANPSRLPFLLPQPHLLAEIAVSSKDRGHLVARRDAITVFLGPEAVVPSGAHPWSIPWTLSLGGRGRVSSPEERPTQKEGREGERFLGRATSNSFGSFEGHFFSPSTKEFN